MTGQDQCDQMSVWPELVKFRLFGTTFWQGSFRYWNFLDDFSKFYMPLGEF